MKSNINQLFGIIL